ncbi:MAG: hypothetical protein RR214_01935, partial [Synergistaceae bacterium]
ALFTDLFSKLNNDFTKATPLEVNGAADQSKIVTPFSLGKGQSGGVASLGADGKVKSSELPGLGKVYSGTATDIEILALIEVGDLYIRKG